MARCADCIHFSLCDYNTNVSGDSKIKLFYEKGAEKCSFYKPTADVVEVKHSTWNEYYSFEKWHYDCPICDFGFAVGIRQEEPPNYCEHCGAKMDKKG